MQSSQDSLCIPSKSQGKEPPKSCVKIVQLASNTHPAQNGLTIFVGLALEMRCILCLTVQQC